MRTLVITFAIAAMLVAVILASRDSHTPAAATATLPASSSNIQVVSITPTPIVQPASAADLFFVRDNDAVTAYDTVTARPRFSLPLGMLSADRKHYVTTAVNGTMTTVRVYDPQTGIVTREMIINGQWTLGAISATGTWLALEALLADREERLLYKENKWESIVEIADLGAGTTKPPFLLDGNFYVDAISADGASLFLIENLPAVNSDHYQVRLYDLNAGQLQEGALVDKRAPDEVMAGDRLEAVPSSDGVWLLSLYLRTRDHTAFIHALNLKDKYAICIDLPSGNGDTDALKQYSLATAPDERTVYATNGALGIVAKIQPDTFGIVRTVEFSPQPVSEEGIPPNTSMSHSVVSPDGRAVYFTSGEKVLALDTYTRQVTGSVSVNQPITGLGLDRTGTRLYVVTTSSPLARVFEVLADGVLKPLD